MARAGAVTRSMTRNAAAALPPAAPPPLPHEIDTASTTRSVAPPAPPQRAVLEPPSPEPAAAAGALAHASLPPALLAKNHMTLLELEQRGALAPGALAITPAGELQATTPTEPDAGTMAGLFPGTTPAPHIDEQIPSWLRDYLLHELNVHGAGPPTTCRALYDGLAHAQHDATAPGGGVGGGLNPSIRTAETLLGYAALRMAQALAQVQDFAAATTTPCDAEARMVAATVQRLVGGAAEAALPADVRVLVAVLGGGGGGGGGAPTHRALAQPLETLVIGPYARLLARLEVVSRALRGELDRVDEAAEKARRAAVDAPDSGVSGCW